MYISHQWSSKTNYFSSQNKYLSSGMPIKSSNYTLKKCSFQIHYLKTVYTDVQVLMCIYLENDSAESHKEDKI